MSPCPLKMSQREHAWVKTAPHWHRPCVGKILTDQDASKDSPYEPILRENCILRLANPIQAAHGSQRRLPLTAFTDIQIVAGIVLKLSLWKSNTVPEVTENSRRQSEHFELALPDRIAAEDTAIRARRLTLPKQSGR
jgi:hypothetical protein